MIHQKSFPDVGKTFSLFEHIKHKDTYRLQMLDGSGNGKEMQFNKGELAAFIQFMLEAAQNLEKS